MHDEHSGVLALDEGLASVEDNRGLRRSWSSERFRQMKGSVGLT